MDRQVNYSVNHGGNFVIKSPLCSFFRRQLARHRSQTQNYTTITVSATSI